MMNPRKSKTLLFYLPCQKINMKNYILIFALCITYNSNAQFWQSHTYDCTILEAIMKDTTIIKYLLKSPDKLASARFVNFSKNAGIILCESNYIDPKPFIYRNTPQVDINDRQRCDIIISNIKRNKKSKVISISVFFIDFCPSKYCHKMMGQMEFFEADGGYKQISSKFSIFD
jgi:hypothetical protein